MEQVPAQTVVKSNLQKSWLVPVRALWLTASLIALAMFIVGLPLRAREIQSWYRGDIQVSLTENQMGDVVLSTWPDSAATEAGVQ
jgi:hypothetical protein